MPEKGKTYTAFIFLALAGWALSIVACDYPEYTSKAEPVGDTFETKVRTHPRWSHNTTLARVSVDEFTEDGTIEELDSLWLRFEELGLEGVILTDIIEYSSPDTSTLILKGPLGINEDRGSTEALATQVAKARSLGIQVLLEVSFSAYHKKHPDVKEHPHWFSPDTLVVWEESYPYYLPLESDSDWVDHISQSLETILSSSRLSGFCFNQADYFSVQFWEQMREDLGEDCFLMGNLDQPDAHHVAYDSTPLILNELFVDSDGLLDLSSEKLVQFNNEKSRFVKNAYRHTLMIQPDTLDTVYTYQNLLSRNILGFTLPGIPVVNFGESLVLHPNDTLFEETYPDSVIRTLVHLKKDHPALWNGMHGGEVKLLPTSNSDVLAYSRTKDSSEVIVIFNISKKKRMIEITNLLEYEYESVFENQTLSAYTNGEVPIGARSADVFIRQKSSLARLIEQHKRE
jgi:hypothetical protein